MSANPAVYDDMTIFRGLTFTKVFTLKAGGVPVNLTGWTAEFKAKASVTSTPNVIDLTSAPGIVLGGTAGTITITVSATDTAAITDSELHYCLKYTNTTEVDGLLIGVIPVDDRAI
jgi:hypothetical protein